MPRRHLSILAFIALLIAALPVSPARAQTDPGGWTLYDLNLRAGPGTNHASLGTLPANTALIFEAQDGSLTWLLARTLDGSQRGWLHGLYLSYRDGLYVGDLPVSAEIINAPAAPDPDPGAASESGTANAATDPADSANIALLEAVPVLPGISGRAWAIKAGGGTNPQRFTKVGDCNTAAFAFLKPFATGVYDLGEYGYLQATIDYYGDSFGRDSQAARDGFNALMVLDPGWANPQWCEPGESVLECELRRSEASVAIIMFGVNDVLHLSPEDYADALRGVADTAISAGAVPVLSTFTWSDSAPYPSKALALNVLTVQVAREYDVPVINLWLAARDLPDHGMMDETHLSYGSPPGSCLFTGQEATSGFTLRNLLVLQTLDRLRG